MKIRRIGITPAELEAIIRGVDAVYVRPWWRRPSGETGADRPVPIVPGRREPA